MKIKSQKQIAADLGISRQTLSKWRRDGVDTSETNIPALMAKAGIGKKGVEIGRAIQEARLRKLTAEAATKEHALAAEHGKYILASDAETEGMRFGLAAKHMWEEIEDSLPPMLEGLTALQMKTKLRDFGAARILELHEFFSE